MWVDGLLLRRHAHHPLPTLIPPRMHQNSDTSRARKASEVDGRFYHFTSRREMEEDIAANRYIEHGEFEGHLYGTKKQTIIDIIDSGRVCLIDVMPSVCLGVVGGGGQTCM